MRQREGGCPDTVQGMIDLIKKYDAIHRKRGAYSLGGARNNTHYAHQQMESDFEDDYSTESEGEASVVHNQQSTDTNNALVPEQHNTKSRSKKKPHPNSLSVFNARKDAFNAGSGY